MGNAGFISSTVLYIYIDRERGRERERERIARYLKPVVVIQMIKSGKIWPKGLPSCLLGPALRVRVPCTQIGIL